MTSLFKACRRSVLRLTSLPACLRCLPTPPSSSTFPRLACRRLSCIFYLLSHFLPAWHPYPSVSQRFAAVKKDIYLRIHHSQRVVLLLVTINKFTPADVSLFLAFPCPTIQCESCNAECLKKDPDIIITKIMVN